MCKNTAGELVVIATDTLPLLNVTFLECSHSSGITVVMWYGLAQYADRRARCTGVRRTVHTLHPQHPTVALPEA